MKSRLISITVALILLVGGYFAYTYLAGPTVTGAPLTVETPIAGQNVKGRDLLKVLLSLNGIKLDEEIFSSPLFTSLEDFTLALPSSGGTGRANPFAPIGTE
ncbi:hypothetical protein KW797_02425 [Candidatus Parcubacteria bacterium]|nr:hypothetical protein [Candidatus Parcubacteria bacterium]